MKNRLALAHSLAALPARVSHGNPRKRRVLGDDWGRHDIALLLSASKR
jgi:hypothetical protein